MSPFFRQNPWLSVSAAALLAAAMPFHAAHAQAPAAPAPPAAEPTPAKAPLQLWVDTSDPQFDREALRAALARELGREVTLASGPDGAVQVHVEGGSHASVRYKMGDELLARELDLPPDRARAQQVVLWLTVNLVRNEAAELLNELRDRRKLEADARAAAEKAAADRAAADKAAAEKVAAEKAAAEKSAAEKAAAEKAAADKAAARAKEPEPLLRDPLRSVDAAVATPLSVLPDSARRELKFQLALAYGESGAIAGVAAAPGVLRMRRDLVGVAVGAGAVFVGQNLRGIATSAGYVQVGGDLEGIALAAGGVYQKGNRGRGIAVAAGGVIVPSFTGVVLAAGFTSPRQLTGIGAAAGANVVRGSSLGILVAAGLNSSARHRGLEVAAGLNMARELEGLALAGVNVHGKVRGFQLGLVNVADDVDGGALGLLSIAKNGRVQPLVFAKNDGSVHLAIKSIAGYAFSQLGGGLELDNRALSLDAGVGAHLKLSEHWFFEPGVHYAAIYEHADMSNPVQRHELAYLAQGGFRLGSALDLLVALGVRHRLTGTDGAPVAPEARLGVAFF